MATKFDWTNIYQDLSEGTRNALVNARIKPEQLKNMSDGELLGTEGINDSALEEIRGKYSADLVADAPVVEKATEKPAETPRSASLHPKMKRPRVINGRSKKYKIKKNKTETSLYSVTEAVQLLKKVAYSKHKTVELHLQVKEIGTRGELTLPFSAGKETRVAIFTPEIANDIKAGKIDFDILLASPKDMAVIAPLARILGPRGLMPNPKNGTVIENPEERAEKLRAGATLNYKTEVKAPLIHLVVGNLDQKDEEIVENINTVLTGITAPKIKTATIKSTMSPAIRVALI